MPLGLRRRAIGLLTLWAALAVLAPACAARDDRGPDAPQATAKALGPPVAYEFLSLDERPVSLEGLKGRAAVLIFVTTYGDPSIVQARFLKKVFKEHSPRINAAAVFLERIDNRPLAYIWRDKLELPFAAAMADEPSIAGKGAFTGVDTVPSVVVLDDQGREVWRKTGVAHPDEIEKALKDAQKGVWGGR